MTMTVNRRVLPSISALAAFEAAARTQSFTEAAEEVGLTQGAVSRQIASLESFLGVRLFDRDRQRVYLTKDGRSYAAEVRPALHRIGTASLRLMVSKDGAGIINLASLPTFGTRWLIPRLPDFFASHPDVSVNLNTRVEPFDFAETDIDAAIHFGHDNWPGTVATRLMGEEIIPVCSADFLKSQAIAQPADLLHLPLLHQRTRPSAWLDWFHAQGIRVDRVPGMRFEQFAMVAQAASAGMGIAILPRFLVADELSSGRLVPLYSSGIRMETAYYFVYPEWNSEVPAILAFRDWLTTEMNAFETELAQWPPLEGRLDHDSH
ncbi:LysR family transcriptional regulator [Coralliovum pocilloporae]|uniref:LysR family transcriptional regulator n=1 Tax=Coralliovum pocilloporae TaxID=3066369 RepID=UPI003306A2FC